MNSFSAFVGGLIMGITFCLALSGEWALVSINAAMAVVVLVGGTIKS